MTKDKHHALHLNNLEYKIIKAVRYASKKRDSMKIKLWIKEAIIEKLERENIQIQESEGDNDVHQ